MLRDLGIELIAANSPDSFVDDTPTAIMVRQILGAVAQFEKAALVSKLKGARARVKAEKGKCEGRKSHAEKRPEVVAEARRLRRASPTTGERRSLQRISRELEDGSDAARGAWPSTWAVKLLNEPCHQGNHKEPSKEPGERSPRYL